MINRVFLLFFSVLLCTGGMAQSPGFLGKRFQVGARLLMNSNFLLYDKNFQSNNPNLARYMLSLKSSFAGEYILNRQSAVGLRLDINNLPYMTKVNRSVFNPTTQLWEPQQQRYSQSNLHVVNTGLSYKKFTQNSLFAPLGVYWQINAGFSSFKLLDREGVTGQKNRSLDRKNGVYAAYSIGRQQMLGKYLLLDIAVEGMINTIYFRVEKDNSKYHNVYTLPNGDAVFAEHYVYSDLLRTYAFNARFGFAWLLL